mmetsp:Transcript_21126/g.24316  ORF Transcript_21126/g.24316 Transcript_21126/m.24316 type:complete len:265 (+) Transcript_21126:97-891(+)|eukprot:CAMPEP_0194355010 /NCGR_PEP_ID=MMETSP0174-20130528/2996_1 /TAXON_ID=216777 /ORGANISM="Proboscia alata, Strain PI-D3" /LENGTH=264 /DNA_ID=CAMNT_0039124117 /DNA_START=94 /DNA_END=888 /DNA_ORIENTATION=+
MDIDEKENLVLKATGWNNFYVPVEPDSKFVVTGRESQVLTVKLPPGDTVKSEPSTMMYMTDGMETVATCEGCCKRICAGEDCCVANFNNTSTTKEAFVALTPIFPTAKVVPIDMSSPEVNGTIIAQQGAFMASYGDVEVDVSLDCNFKTCCCGGMGLVRQKLTGTGTAFISGTGTIVQKVLEVGEVLLCDDNNIMAFSESVKLDIQRTGGVMGMIGGGEGIVNTHLTGPGLVIVQSVNAIKFRQTMARQYPKSDAGQMFDAIAG